MTNELAMPGFNVRGLGFLLVMAAVMTPSRAMQVIISATATRRPWLVTG